MTYKPAINACSQRQVAKELWHEQALPPAHLIETSTQCDTCIWPISKEFRLIWVTPLKINTCLFHPELSWFSNTVSIKGLMERLNHLSKVGNKLKSAVRVKVTFPWITRVPSGSVQKNRNDKASPYWPSITSNHASQRDMLHPARFSASAPVHVSQATALPLGLMPIRTLQRQWMSLSSSYHFG